MLSSLLTTAWNQGRPHPPPPRYVGFLLGSATQLLEAVEDGGYEAKLRSSDDEGNTEIDDPEIKAAKVSRWRDSRQGRARTHPARTHGMPYSCAGRNVATTAKYVARDQERVCYLPGLPCVVQHRYIHTRTNRVRPPPTAVPPPLSLADSYERLPLALGTRSWEVWSSPFRCW